MLIPCGSQVVDRTFKLILFFFCSQIIAHFTKAIGAGWPLILSRISFYVALMNTKCFSQRLLKRIIGHHGKSLGSLSLAQHNETLTLHTYERTFEFCCQHYVITLFHKITFSTSVNYEQWTLNSCCGLFWFCVTDPFRCSSSLISS